LPDISIKQSGLWYKKVKFSYIIQLSTSRSAAMPERSLNTALFFIEGFQYRNPSFLSKLIFKIAIIKRFFEVSIFKKILSSYEKKKLRGFLNFYIYIMRNFYR